MKSVKHLIKAILFPVFSLLSRRTGFAVFFPSMRGWALYTRRKMILPSGPPGMDSLEYFRRFVPKTGGIVFDVGGELGIQVRQFSRMVGPQGKVFSFECFPDHIDLLHNLAAQLQNVTIVDRACWNKTEELKFYRGNTPGSNTAVAVATGIKGQQLADKNIPPITVQATTLDKMWKEFTEGQIVDFLKMDIEGAEWEALEGATELLRNTNRVVVAAYHRREGVITTTRVKEILNASGFQVHVGDNLHVYGERIKQ